MSKTQKLGNRAETLACRYLQKQGLKLIARNFSCKLGEIDLIMQQKNTLVFIEVRMRNNPFYGTGLDSITWHKRQKIIRTAQYYLLKNHFENTPLCRFDVVSVTMHSCQTTVQWLPDAFSLEE